MYRYSQKKYNESLYVMGGVRVGTLHDFRKSEHKRGIADPKEGTKTVKHHVDNLHIADSSDPMLQHDKDFRALDVFNAIKLGPGCTNISISNVSMTQSFNEPDCFILCTSKLKAKTTMAQFEGANSCTQIKNINNFYQLLTQTICEITPVIFRGVHEAIYQDRNENWNGQDWGHHPAMIKELQFREQGELRAIWQPRFHHSIQPLLVSDWRLGSCIEFVSFE